MKNRSQSTSVYQIVTDRIVAKLESGVVPWRRPWGEYGAPQNLASKRAYRGVNVFLLSAMGFESPYWLTYKQAQERGGSVRKGEHSTPVVFWKVADKDETDEAGQIVQRRIPVLRYYNVFNVAQCDGIEAPPALPVSRPFEPLVECERIISAMPNAPTIQHREARAYYAPTLDLVNMPLREAFTGAPEYYSTLFHELTHSTGHEKRLGRRGSNVVRHFGDRDYSQEELVAEMGAAFLSSVAGIESATLDSSAAYLHGWIRRLRGDAKLIVVAAAQAQKAADFILAKRAADDARIDLLAEAHDAQNGIV